MNACHTDPLFVCDTLAAGSTRLTGANLLTYFNYTSDDCSTYIYKVAAINLTLIKNIISALGSGFWVL